MPALPISPDHEHTHSKGPCGRVPLRSTWSERVTWLPLAAREDGGQAQGLYVRLNPVVICHLGARRIATPNETRARLAGRDESRSRRNGVCPSWRPASVLRSRPRCPGQAHIASPQKYLRASPEGTSALRSLRSRPSRPLALCAAARAGLRPPGSLCLFSSPSEASRGFPRPVERSQLSTSDCSAWLRLPIRSLITPDPRCTRPGPLRGPQSLRLGCSLPLPGRPPHPTVSYLGDSSSS